MQHKACYVKQLQNQKNPKITLLVQPKKAAPEIIVNLEIFPKTLKIPRGNPSKSKL